MKKLTGLIVAAAVGLAVGLSAAQSSRPDQDSAVQFIELPIKFPVVGNISAVRQWRLGRLESAEMTAGTDVILRIRLANGTVVRVSGPGPLLAELAFRSDWVRAQSRQFPGAPDIVERMIAFDFDESNRIIAFASLEPINRNRNRLWRTLN